MDSRYLNLSPSKLLKIKAHEEKIAKYQAFESSLMKIIHDFLISALTMICRDKKLVPNHRDIFSYNFKFGLNVPVFANPQARMYIEGIVKKAVALIRQNALHACIFHVKEARLYCHQRFVFKVEGDWSLSESKTRDASSILLRLENHCYNCLLKLMSVQSDLKDLQLPQFSRWSISLGLREEFISILKENNILNPFQNDPDNHFPWKPTVRPSKTTELDTPIIGDSDPHPPPIVTVTNTDNSNVPINVDELNSPIVPKEVTEQPLGVDAENQSTTVKKENDAVITNDGEYLKDDEVMMDLDEILDNDSDRNNSFTNEEWTEEDDAEEDEESSVFLVPIYSFKIVEGLIFNIFALDYSEIVEKQMKLLGQDQFLASTKGA